MNAKDEALAAIDRARAEMEEAICQLEHVPMFDTGQIAYAAHAMQSYVTLIDATTGLLAAKLRNVPDEEIDRWLNGLQHVTQLMSHTVCQLMNTGSPAPSLKMTSVNFPTLASRACAYYRRLAARKDISISFQSADGTPNVWVDGVALAAALDNLLSNAIKYSPPGKAVRVEIGCDGASVFCKVRDEGPGISEPDQTKLFRKGARLASMPTGGEPATGYGLAVAKDLVTKIGGEITCESKLGAGACFTICLPVLPQVAVPQSTERFKIPVRMDGA